MEPHFKTVHIRFHYCSFCNIQFPSRQALSEHWKSCAGYKFGGFGCEKCDEKFSTKDYLKDHYMAFHPKELLCSKCNMYSPSRQSCLEHVKICKEKLENSELSCSICRISFSNKQLLSEHFLKVHPIGFLCSNCKKHFTSKGSCLKHARICKRKLDQSKIALKKAFPCKIAPKKAFPCDKCGLTPRNKQQMLLHFEKCTNIQAKENLVETAMKIAATINLKTLKQSLKPKPKVGPDNSKEYVCSKCNIPFRSYESAVLHFNSCNDSRIEMLGENLQNPIIEKFSLQNFQSTSALFCSNCDMDFDDRETLKEHSEKCEIAMLQPGEEHFDHTYSKGVFPAANLKRNIFGTDGKVRPFIQSPVKTVTKQIPNFESNEIKTEVKEENFEDFEALEQLGIDYITSKDFDPPSIESETFKIKTEIKSEVKEEAFEEFDAHEQIGMDFVTSEGFDTLSTKSDISSILTKMKTDINKTEINKIEVEEDTFDDFELAQMLIFN